MQFEPIAVVGSSCTLPGALSPGALWDNVLAGRSAITGSPAERWGLPRALAMGTVDQWADRTWSDAGGYVSGFEERFDPEGLLIPGDEVRDLDPLFKWVLHGVREALRPIGHQGRSPRAGLILGNLSFPSHAMARYAHSVWLDQQGKGFARGRAREIAGVVRPHAYNRFMSGLPATLAARALGLDACAVALDAACASSLYAIKLACDRLHDRKADVMVAGAVNGADDLFIHIGFCALSAMSRTGQSRPFHREADGLVPAEGASFAVLKRLKDAVVAGDPILGVIRGIGLSNDGRGRGLLVPSEEGQIRAMQRAYAMSDLSPRDIGVIECHATGTPVGDATEIHSMTSVFEGLENVPIGSIKSNLGHPVTAAGMAGLIKVLCAMEANVLPPMRPVDRPIEAIAASPFRLLGATEPWPADRPRRAALNAFGFGGNNAHLIVEQWSAERAPSAISAVPVAVSSAVPVAIVGLCAMVGDDQGTAEFAAQLFSTLSTPPIPPRSGTRRAISISLEGLRFPPNDIRQTLPQQLFILEAAREAVRGLTLPRELTGVLIGIGTDPEIARYGARWQLASWSARWASALGIPLRDEWTSAAQEVVQSQLVAAGVLGTMPNIPANRINSQLDLASQSMTVSAEELSGVAALEFAVRALSVGELDAAVVGAVDLSDEVVHRTALAELGIDRTPADGAVVLVLKRLADARRDGDRVFAVLDENGDAPSLRLGAGEGCIDLLAARGNAHAASGLLHVAAAVLAVHHGVRPGSEGKSVPWVGSRVAEARTQALLGPSVAVTVRADGPAQPLSAPVGGGSAARRGPTLSIPAHRSEIRLPPLEGDMQFMVRAPWLPPVLDESSLDPAKSTQKAPSYSAAPAALRAPVAAPVALPAAPAAAPAAVPVLAAAADVASHPVVDEVPLPHETFSSPGYPTSVSQTPVYQPTSGLAAILSRAAEQQARVAAVHQEFLAGQAAAQQRFLSLQQAMLTSLVTSYPSASAAPPVQRAWPDAALPRSTNGVASHEALSTPVAVPALPSRPASDDIAPVPQVSRGLPGSHEIAEPRPRLPEGSNGAAQHAPAQPIASAPAQPVASALAKPTASAPAEVKANGAARPSASSTSSAPSGPTFSRAEVHVHAAGRISSIFGPQFENQDAYVRQVRMPKPPLLLVDRVTGIDAPPGKMGTGTLWTETDVREDSWYLHDGRMPAGIMIESGQADLMLISWMGVDRLNQSERVYRLLGCELTYHGELPRIGDVLDYDIHVDGHAKQDEIRLFFFHYDCRINGRLALSVRHGQAGFFTDAELKSSAGVLWDAETAEHPTTGPLDPPAVDCVKHQFSADEVRAFSEGRVLDCFGPGFERAQTHVRTPRIASERMLLLHRITQFDVRGGPWGRGYLRAEMQISPDDWFFEGHFMNDPCMPGTLMFEGCIQAMSFYLTAMGFTLQRDGSRFEPISGQKSAMRCRGQVTPVSKLLVYELFVHEVSNGAIPELRADLLCTVDGLKAFHAERFGVRIVPDWPLEVWKLGSAPEPARASERRAPLDLRRLGGLGGYVEPKPVATNKGFAFDYASLLACAWGRPSTAFGPFYERFDSPRRVARLPGPPYHFVSRVVRTEGEMGGLQSGSSVEVEYDVPASVWYLDDNGSRTMPFSVLMEAALQPCGWLASYVGSTLTSDIDMMFRNLDGTSTLTSEILPDAGVLRTRARIVNISRSAGMIIESFEVECFLGDTRIYKMNTAFGFFPKEAFDNQAGLPVTDEDRARVAQPSSYSLDLRARPARYFAGAPRLAGGMLFMLDRITAHDARGGRKGLGWARAEKDVNPAEWFFKAHFFQDPVQPGSLGIEALCQLLQFVMIEQGMMEGIEHGRFEPVALGRPVTWKYRGQVVPSNRVITTEVEITEAGEDERGRYALADAYLWVDGKRIYHAKGLGMRIVAGSPAPEVDEAEEVLDPAVDTWLGDHRPTWTLPALPMMSMVDRLAGAAQRRSGQAVLALSDVHVKRWLPFPGGPIRLRTEVQGEGAQLDVTLSAWREAKNVSLSRFEPVATGRVLVGAASEAAPAPWPPLADGELIEEPYASGTLFHGPAFQMLRSLRLTGSGASAVLDAGADGVPPGALRQGLLDALTHAIPHDAFCRWSQDIASDLVAYPYRIPHLRLHGALPAQGEVRVEVRFAGFDGDPRLPRMDVQLIVGTEVRVELSLVEILLPKGPLGVAPPLERRAFLRDRKPVPGLGLSRDEAREQGSATRLGAAVVQQSDWLPGNVARIYGVPPGAALVEQVAVRDHVARRASVHPATVVPAPDLTSAVTAMRPLRRYPIQVAREGEDVVVTDAGPAVVDLSPVHDYWRKHFAIGPWPVEDLYYGLIEHFVGDVVLSDPEAFAQVRGRSVLYLANHQVGIESLLFSVLIPALSGVVSITLAKAEHRTSWLGQLIEHCFSYPGVKDPGVITFFNREDQSALLAIVQQLAVEMTSLGKSAMIHVEGTRSVTCRQPVIKMSSAVIEMALAAGCPIVPVRFIGGLPVEELPQRSEFPVGYGRQDVWIGRPLFPEQLRALPLKERKQVILDGINGLGLPASVEVPNAPDPELSARVNDWSTRTGASTDDATLFAVLDLLKEPESVLTRRLLEGARAGRLAVGDEPEAQWLATLARRLFGPRGPSVGSP